MTKKLTATPKAELTNEETAHGEALAQLAKAGRLAAAAGEHRAAAKDEGANAANLLIAGLTAPGMLALRFGFDILNKEGKVTDSASASMRDYLTNAPIFKNENGSAARSVQTAFRSEVLPKLFGVPGDQSAGAKAAWAMVAKYAPVALALSQEGMHAEIAADGKLKAVGGSGDRADALRAALDKSVAQAVKAVSGQTGTQGGTDAPKGDAASPSEILQAALDIVRKIAKGDEAISNAGLSRAREIALLVTSNPEAFGEGL